MDYESPLASRVAGDVWSGLSRAALEAGFTKTTAHWESLREARIPTEGPPLHVFAIGQDRPDAIDAVGAVGDRWRAAPLRCDRRRPEQTESPGGIPPLPGRQRLTETGVKAGMVEPALLHAVPAECERYARRLLERLGSP